MPTYVRSSDIRRSGVSSPSAIREFLAGRGRKIGTQRNILRVLSPIMDLAVQDRMIRANPCTQVRLRSNGEGHAEMRLEWSCSSVGGAQWWGADRWVLLAAGGPRSGESSGTLFSGILAAILLRAGHVPYRRCQRSSK
jgi:hypothetical protein